MTKINFTTFEEKTGIVFNEKRLLEKSFTHRSYINENPEIKTGHNERLEFLGDAVLELITTYHLFRLFPDKAEGELTAYRSALVNAIIIASVAEEIGMNEYLLLSKGESKDTGKARTYILANTYEAYLGAVYIDQGYDVAKKFVTDTLLPKLDVIIKEKLWRDAKSLIQEKAQEHHSVTPSYTVMSESGPDHDKAFVVGVFFGKELVGTGKGKSKQEAEQAAARAAITEKGWLD